MTGSDDTGPVPGEPGADTSRPADDEPVRTWSGVVAPGWIDANGHMSEGWYGMVFGWATDALIARIGAAPASTATSDSSAVDDRGGTYFTVEAHTAFLDGLASGADVAVDTAVLGVDGFRVRLFHELWDLDADTIAATQESLLTHVDPRTGRMAPAPDDVVAAARALVRAHAGSVPDDEVGRAIAGP